VLATIAICWLWANADGSTKYPLPELTRLDSIAIAALRGGRALVIQTAVFRLWDRKLIDISGEGSNAVITIQGESQHFEAHRYSYESWAALPQRDGAALWLGEGVSRALYLRFQWTGAPRKKCPGGN
jgi:uncharacterized protein (TIGR04222 family)